MTDNRSPNDAQPSAIPSAIVSRLVGRPRSAVAAASLAVLASFLVARRVAATNAYLQIQYALPTYDGSTGPAFFVGGAALVGLAVASSYADAGLLPTVVLAGAPVFGWAVNHVSAPITPHYAVTYPVEMAVLYGVVFGLVGYVLGSGLRSVAPPSRAASLVR